MPVKCYVQCLAHSKKSIGVIYHHFFEEKIVPDYHIIKRQEGLPWQSNGKDSTLPMQVARLDPWLGNLRFRMPHSGQNKQTNKNKRQERGRHSFPSPILADSSLKTRLSPNSEVFLLFLKPEDIPTSLFHSYSRCP